jgi:hypothetical protein
MTHVTASYGGKEYFIAQDVCAARAVMAARHRLKVAGISPENITLREWLGAPARAEYAREIRRLIRDIETTKSGVA